MADIEQKIDRALKRIYSSHPTNDFRPLSEIKSNCRDADTLKVLQRQGFIVSRMSFSPVDYIENLDSWALSAYGLERAKASIVGGRWTTKTLAFASAMTGIAGTVLGSFLDSWLK